MTDWQQQVSIERIGESGELTNGFRIWLSSENITRARVIIF